jgi:hypothetical protein
MFKLPAVVFSISVLQLVVRWRVIETDCDHGHRKSAIVAVFTGRVPARLNLVQGETMMGSMMGRGWPDRPGM